jgi:hypothetical protein
LTTVPNHAPKEQRRFARPDRAEAAKIPKIQSFAREGVEFAERRNGRERMANATQSTTVSAIIHSASALVG